MRNVPDFGSAECGRCGATFTKRREAQCYCTERCRNSATKARSRSGEAVMPYPSIKGSGDTPSAAALCKPPLPSTPYFNPHGPTPGALQGDDYPLEFYQNGFPKLPECLRRTREVTP